MTLPRILCTLAAIGLALISLPTLAMQPFKIEYQASYMGLQANSTMTLAMIDNNQWRYTLHIQNQLVNLTQSTIFNEKNSTLRPLSNDDVATLLVKKRKIQAEYDWDTLQATWSGDIKADRRGPVALKEGDMDGLLINLAIVRDVQAGKQLLNYRLVDGGKIKPMTYTVVGKEEITVNGKTQQATKVSRTDGDNEISAWIIPGLPIPARLVQKEKGHNILELMIKSLN
ncbi:DUF3108 domain-containing protein [Xylella fastidiosa subsp. multiplex]|uniref:DUF3108 domain-containing protein n=1 Tax=Xylella fastidiosa subsp. multiplex TaxID=644357 RepID=A0A9Q4MLC9_XYLFS|nr:DUF3108 domain-containing protein [Xylella fastidiosa]ERI61080.1 hypothetical protein M233_00230 [Xylella fastidiosa subsp. multiplex Griffin-1]ACA12624.1 conserved hypothetical protein [Xylella fastidiosa M12]KAJ4853249.1 DUF3108 domain-containing protein [Xylella fastidiosa subsp. multiplex]MBE0268247.1 DUF3108 domain-containing protein [Xylella fastidiosa subsp. multiplex]MBE0274820.1 DUF3108 domain-containing protein [Xylella fastidiosa subsp. multiplex]